MKHKMEQDFAIIDHGSVVLLRPYTDAARDWIADNVETGNVEWSGALVIEPRFVADIVSAMQEYGLDGHDALFSQSQVEGEAL